MKRLIGLCGAVIVALSLALAFPLAALAADSAVVDNDLATNGPQKTVYISSYSGETVNTTAQLVIERGTGSNHLSVGNQVVFDVDTDPAQTNLPSGYTASQVTLTIPSPWTNEGQKVYDDCDIQFTAPAAPGSYSYQVKWNYTNYGNKLNGTPNFFIILTVSAPSDTTPPVITHTISGTLGFDGWYTSDVTVVWTATDAESTATPAGQEDTVTTDTTGVTLTFSATSAGGTSSQSVTIKRDATPPTITASRTPEANVNGWNNTDVTASYEASDAISGLAPASTGSYLFNSEGAGQSHTFTVYDNAGNTNSATVDGINIDNTVPTISASQTPDPNSYGWNNTDVTISYSVGDTLSGIDESLSDYADDVLSSEGSGLSASGIVYDKAGNSATAGVSNINIDKTAPTITAATPTGTAGNNDWYISDVTVPFSATDNLSGFEPSGDLSTNLASKTTTGEGSALYVTSDGISDMAGNYADGIQAGPFKVDKTKPVITITTPADGAIYTLNQVVNANWSATDATSGIASASGTVASGLPINTSSVGSKTFSVNAEDNAGNTDTRTVTYKVAYIFSGILQPIDADGSSIFKLGSTIPVKFQLKDANGAYVSSAVARINVAKVSNNIVGDDIEAVSTSAATTGNLFRYDLTANQYIFNLSTKLPFGDGTKWSAGTWQIKIILDDGNIYTVLISLR